MTCIVGIETAEGVYIGADSMASNGWSQAQTLLPKVFQTGPFLIGYTSSFRMGQILQYKLKVRDQTCDETVDEYLVCSVIEAVRDILKTFGYAKVSDNEETGGQFLLGYRKQLRYVGSDFQINHSASGINAVGCGADYALGAMVATPQLKPRNRLKNALEIASTLSSGVCPPFHIEKLKDVR
jgi:ATP-dependent protease HslVU (ClpYQ) peptidase subunit